LSEKSIEEQAKKLAEKRLLNVPEALKRCLPKVLQQDDVTVFTFLTETYFVLSFANPQETERIEELIRAGKDPFPGLITNTGRSIFRTDRSKNTMVGEMTGDGYSFSLGKDSTIVLYNYRQKLGSIVYDIDLAYIVSFGDEINPHNLLYYLEDLIAYSIKTWKHSHA